MALLLLIAVSTQCAKKGSPSGGAKDTIAPNIVRTVPENFSTNFDANEIRIVFNEYIKLEELQKNLLISPPMEYPPVITPLSTSKTLKISIQDTLLENTTYSISFGNSIVDNNESIPFEDYKYVFSTGPYIDSLTLSGSIRDVERPRPENPTTVALYEITEGVTDSMVYTQKPTYVTRVKDDADTFQFTNLKAGTYLLVALKDEAKNYTFQPKTDKIAFANSSITLPTDSTYTLNLFKETSSFKPGNPRLAGKQHIALGYEGDAENLTLAMLSDVPPDFRHTSYREATKDTLHYWFKPNVVADSLVLAIANGDLRDTVSVWMKELYRDSLEISAVNAGVQIPTDTLRLQANIPLTSVNESNITVIRGDSVSVPFRATLREKFNQVRIAFQKEPSQAYNVSLLPGALIDFFGATNDTLQYRVQTRALADYGTLRLSLSNIAAFPVIVQLVDTKFNLIAQRVLSENKPILFEYLTPAQYYVRVIFDTNENARWDTGWYLEGRQPEEIIYYPAPLEVRANWDLNETFRLTERNRDPSETEAVPEDR